MKSDEWKLINHFKSNEEWGDPSKINFLLVQQLDLFREEIGSRCIVTCGTQGKHMDGSYHYKGLAVDIIVPEWTGSVIDLIFESMRFKFQGIGYYDNWRYCNKKVPGFHFDMRPTPSRALWIGTADDKGNQIYKEFSFATLKKLGAV